MAINMNKNKVQKEDLNYMYNKYVEETSLKYLESKAPMTDKDSYKTFLEYKTEKDILKKDEKKSNLAVVVEAYNEISSQQTTKNYKLSKIEEAMKEKEDYESFYDNVYETALKKKSNPIEENEIESDSPEDSYEYYDDFSSEHYNIYDTHERVPLKIKKNGYIDSKKKEVNINPVKTVKDLNKIISENTEREMKILNSQTSNPKPLSNKINSSYSSKQKIGTTIEIPTPELFEKVKFLQANWFMKIGHYVGLSLRNQYYKNLDTQVKSALKDGKVYRVLEAQKNGYYLGKKLNKLTIEALYKSMTTKPMPFINELVNRDVILSMDNLSLVLLSSQGQELVTNQNPTNYPETKKLFEDLLNKENFLYANKNIWLRSVSNKEQFLKEDNALFYHEKMLAICEKSELLGVKKELEKFLQEEDVLKSISKNKLIDKMLLKLDIQLGHSIDLDHMITDLPQVAQKLYKSIKEIIFSQEDMGLLETSHKFEFELVEKRMPEAIIKYLSVDSQYRDNLKNNSGKTAENLLIETLENILVTKKDLNVMINQHKLSELSVTRRYTDTIRGEAGKPSIFTLKTLQQLRDSGELIDLANEKILEKKNVENPDMKDYNSQIKNVPTAVFEELNQPLKSKKIKI